MSLFVFACSSPDLSELAKAAKKKLQSVSFVAAFHSPKPSLPDRCPTKNNFVVLL